MKIIKNLTFAALTAWAVALLFQTSMARADNHGKRDEHGQQAKITFTKWVTALVNQPGLIATMTGAGDGDAGDVFFAGDVLKQSPLPPAGVVAVYNFTGTKHSFTALIHGFQPVAGIGQKGVIVGVVIDGWLKGHALKGEWTVIAPCYATGTGVGNCFAVTLEIERDSKD
ncbi:MAG: hypothetical protein L0Z50_09355 [Verrucomicrobiales bacterium]|nr:hypothetical protein [Verrucomicrobiales bacterium]